MNAGSQSLPTGTRIGKYEITQVLGIGGFGITYKAWDHRLEWNVAIKEYLPTAYAFRDRDTTAVKPLSADTLKEYQYGLQRFLAEARTLAKFKDPNIVRVLDHIEANGTAYLVMDFEEGETLASRLKREGSLSEDALLSVVLPILSGLRTMHGANILHRDIKPGNIYLRLNGSPVLIDFGSAKQDLSEHTRSLTTMVTAGFAPFEQYSNKAKQGPYTDLYALGATIYRCINGNVPLPQSADRIIGANDVEKDPLIPAVQTGAGRYSRYLLEAVDWMLMVHPKNRPQTVDALLAKIAPDQVSRADTASCATTRIVSGPSLHTDADTATVPTLPTMEVEVRDISSNRLPQAKQRPRRKPVAGVMFTLAATSAAALGIGIWQNWIDVDYDDIDFLKGSIARFIDRPQTLIPSLLQGAEPAPTDARTTSDSKGQTVTASAVPAASTRANGEADPSGPGRAGTPAGRVAAGVAAASPAVETGNGDVSLSPTQKRETPGLAVTTGPAGAPSPAGNRIPGPTKQTLSPATARISDSPSGEGADPVPAETPTKAGEIRPTPDAEDSRVAVSHGQTRQPVAGAGETVAAQSPPEETAAAPLPAEDPTLAAERERQQKIRDLLERGRRLQQTGNLTRPRHDNALDAYKGVLEVDPSNAEAAKALETIGTRLRIIAEDKLREKQFAAAQRYIDLALAIQNDNRDWLTLKDQIAGAQEIHRSRQKKLDQLFRRAEELEAKGVSFADSGENAADVYLKLLELDNTHKRAREGLIRALSFNLELLQSNPSLEGYQNLSGYAAKSLERAPDENAIRDFSSDVQREFESWEERQNAPKITRIITTNTEPTPKTQPQSRFRLSVPRIYVAFDFQNFESGSVIRAVLFDGGQKIKLMQVPVVITGTQGTRTFYLNKPIDGFQIGSYRLEMNLGEEHIATADFVIDE